MLILLYLAVLIPAVFWVVKTLGPEMMKPPLPKKVAPKPVNFDFSQSNGEDITIKRLETLLAEKNKNITLLQNELKILYVQVQSFDKIKALMEEEIHRLREQNRIFRSELGIPAAQPKENPITT